MAIDSVNNTAISQLLYPPSSTSVSGSNSDTGSDTDPTRVGGTGGASRFASAISQALTQIGVTPADASNASGASTTATQDPKQAAQAFASALFGALHAQDSGTPGGSSDGVPKAGGGHHHGGGGGKVEGGLQKLIQTLSAGATSDSGGSAATSPLQTAFDNLVSANGGTPGNASLTSFLQNLAQDLHGAPSAGNVVSTNA